MLDEIVKRKRERKPNLEKKKKIEGERVYGETKKKKRGERVKNC